MSELSWTKLAVHRAYDRILPRWSKYRALMADTMSQLESARTVLDAGCGSGILAERLAEMGARVEGVDTSREMVAAANARRGRSQVGANLRFSQQDGSSLQFASETFDAVASTNVVFAVRDPLAYLRELQRVLRVGGRLVISGPTPGAAGQVEALAVDLQRDLERQALSSVLADELAVVLEVNRDLAARSFGWTYRAPQIASLLAKLGFDIDVSHERHYDGALFFVAAHRH